MTKSLALIFIQALERVIEKFAMVPKLNLGHFYQQNYKRKYTSCCIVGFIMLFKIDLDVQGRPNILRQSFYPQDAYTDSVIVIIFA